jgi:LacI family transcriptional regulator
MKMRMDDIAKLAHVSRSAVSIAVNGKPGISDEVRAKIFKVIDETGYTPLRNRKKSDSQSLARVRLLVITSEGGMISANYRSLPFFDNLVNSLSDLTVKLGGSFDISILNLSQFNDEITAIKQHSATVPTIILGSDMSADQVIQLSQAIDHNVFVDTYYPDIQVDFVTMDNFKGAYTAGQYILDKGYKNIGYVASKVWIGNFQERRRGFYAALSEKNIEIRTDHVYRLSPTQMMPDLDDEIERLINTDNRPEAVFCENDVMAVRVSKALQNAGVKVPDDIAIMGFDDIPEGRLITPELSTIHVPINQIVNQCLQQLAAQTRWDKWRAQTVFVSTDLVKRQSL